MMYTKGYTKETQDPIETRDSGKVNQRSWRKQWNSTNVTAKN